MRAATDIRFQNVTKTWPQPGGRAVTALDDVTLNVPAGSITGIIGRSGAGKSTLLRMANGLERPTGGTVTLGERDVGRASGAGLRRIRRDVGMIFQHFNLLSNRTVRGNIALPLEIAGQRGPAVAARVAELVGLVGLSEQADRYPAELSGGQKQRVGIARALATGPRVLLSDEATSALDPETTRSVLGLLSDINARLGLTILLITHEMAVVRQICTHVAVIDAGRIVEAGETYRVFSNPAHPVTRSFLAGITTVALPGFVAGRITPERAPGPAQAVMQVTFIGDHATEPMLSRLTRDLGLDVNILAGAIEEIGPRPFGNLLVALDADRAPQAAATLEEHGMMTRVLGYVA
ncbi:methionine ABC transporter ATP-binding protein [Paracoccus luteus]|uniref:methionine ABC transporter ATP-binding protein n=1 Tax=Paracoccus luteus TaxID=2508543 RepID=UPI0014300286|nr:ATP-binding cassette domain-containing protein [Paracoccus luteus]